MGGHLTGHAPVIYRAFTVAVQHKHGLLNRRPFRGEVQARHAVPGGRGIVAKQSCRCRRFTSDDDGPARPAP